MDDTWITVDYEQLDPELFPGFYESVLMLPLEDAANCLVEDLEEAGEDAKDWNIRYQDLDKYKMEVAKYVCQRWNDILAESGFSEFIRNLEVKSIWSPREYNFLTDKLVCRCEIRPNRFLRFVQEERESIQDYVYETWKSRSGFYSLVPYRYSQWEEFLDSEYSQHIVVDYILCRVLGMLVEDGPFDYNDDLALWMSDFSGNHCLSDYVLATPRKETLWK